MPTITDAIFPQPPRPPIGPPVPPIGPLPLQYQHTTTQDNIKFPWYWTQLDYPALNGNPVAIITVTPVGVIQVNNQAASATIIQNPYAVGVLYNPFGDERWYIYNLGLEAMNINAVFNVAINQESEAQ